MRLLDDLLDLLYPPRCPFCRKLLRQKSDGVCRACLDHLPYTGALAERARLTHISHCFAPLFYENDVRESLHRFKFAQRSCYAGIYAGFMVKCIDENQISCDIIGWAPVSRRRLRQRGYDQSELLARAIAARKGLECCRVLDKVRDTPPQSRTKNVRQRLDNVKGAYRCADPSLVSGKRILLIDDIVTSGATLSECARVLKAAGAAEIIALAVARKRD